MNNRIQPIELALNRKNNRREFFPIERPIRPKNFGPKFAYRLVERRLPQS